MNITTEQTMTVDEAREIAVTKFRARGTDADVLSDVRSFLAYAKERGHQAEYEELLRVRIALEGYDLEVSGKGKKTYYRATYRATGTALCQTLGLPATLRLIDVDAMRRLWEV